MSNAINKCRICGNTELKLVLDLGIQALTGHFLKSIDQPVALEPLQLVKCIEDMSKDSCGLLQLKHSSDPYEMYGENYGYRSGLNQSMVDHLERTVDKLLERIDLKPDDLVVDIGSSDATLLKAYPQIGLTLVGIDPVAKTYSKYYPEHVQLIPNFFSSNAIHRCFPGKKAKLITSIAMFYDLERPLEFMNEIHDVLDDEGLWLFEQSYMPTMIHANSYDTVCHEHLLYYGLKQIKWLTDRAGLKIVDVEVNKVNGGSIAVMAAKSNSSYRENSDLVNDLLSTERNGGFSTLTPYVNFSECVQNHKREFCDAIGQLKREGSVYCGYGASTKGNVILQFCELTAKEIPFIAEVNERKFDCFTPGSNIPIISEENARAKNPEVFIVFPWHFKEAILKKEKLFLNNGGALLFPLPEVTLL